MVVLPEPFGPISEKISPAPILNETPLTAVLAPKLFFICFTSSMASLYYIRMPVIIDISAESG